MKLRLGETNAVQEFLGRARRQEPRDEEPRALLKGAAGSTIGIALDPSVGRVCRRCIDPGQLERLAVDPGGVAIAAIEIDRAIRDDPVEVGAIRDPAGKVGERPAAALDPRQIGVRPGICRDDLEEPIEPGRAPQVALEPLETRADWMDVRVTESRR